MKSARLCVAVMAAMLALSGCGDSSENRVARTAEDVKKRVEPPASASAKDGIAFIVLLDTSGSMEGHKLQSAKQCVISIVKQAEEFSAKRGVAVEMAVYRFASDSSIVVPMGKPNVASATPRINGMSAGGSTGIGDAVMRATRQLNESGYTSKHVLVVTDGENTAGTPPDDVARGFKSLAENLRPNVYLVAFDVDAAVFKVVKEAGWPVYSATNETQLRQTLDQVVGGEILLEK